MISSSSQYFVRYHKPEKLVSLIWQPGTASMTDEDFKGALEVFAEGALQHRAQNLLIDMLEFRHRPSEETLAWRDEVIVPKYNRAGVKKIAWIWPDVAAEMGTGEGTDYTNRYFANEEEALAWIVA